MIFRRRPKDAGAKVVRHLPRCSFCAKEQGDGGVRLIAGSGVYICSACIELAGEMLRGGNRPAPA